MTAEFSLSIFTIEADLKPLLAFAARKQKDAETLFRDDRMRTKLRSASSGGVPLCDEYSILRIRLANADERARYREKLAARRRQLPRRSFWSTSTRDRPPRLASNLPASLLTALDEVQRNPQQLYCALPLTRCF
jgi:hypothetical protein